MGDTPKHLTVMVREPEAMVFVCVVDVILLAFAIHDIYSALKD